MSDTPRTDAEVFAVDVAFVSHDGLASEPKNVVEPDFARQLERENAALRKDQERLDWLTNSLGWVIVGYPEADPSNHATEDNTLADAWRAAIDAARAKKAKP